MGKIVAVGSGCGGAGKSTVALSLAVCAARHENKTVLLDASGVPRACDLMLGLESIVVLDMMDVVRQQASIQNALYRVTGEEHLFFACASLYEGIAISELSGVLLALRAMCDLLIIDMPTGPMAFSKGILDENDAVLLVTRPDDISIRALERAMSVMEHGRAARHLVINHLSPNLVKKKAQYPAASVEMILDMPASGVITEEESITIGVDRGKAAVNCSLKTRGEFERLLKNVL